MSAAASVLAPTHAAAAPAAAGPREVPAITLEGVWKLFGPPRRVRAASASIGGGPPPDRDALQRRYGVFAAVAGISLQVRCFEILAIVGASGSGKSTLVRHMNALIKPSCGSVSVDGRRLDSLSKRQIQDLRSTQVGMVFQSTSLFPHRNVIDNVAFGLEVRGLARDERYRRAREWLSRVALTEWASHVPAELSGGMQQRVGLARTFVTEPDTLLLDEPFSALDPIIRRSLQDQFVELVRAYNKTAVFITHDFAEAVRVGDRIGVMENGRIVQIGMPADIIARPASPYVASFATPELRRNLVRAADIAEPFDVPGREVSAEGGLRGDATLAEISERLQCKDGRLEVTSDDGRVIGWIDRGILLRHLAKAL